MTGRAEAVRGRHRIDVETARVLRWSMASFTAQRTGGRAAI
jgi:hypothetical protein